MLTNHTVGPEGNGNEEIPRSNNGKKVIKDQIERNTNQSYTCSRYHCNL